MKIIESPREGMQGLKNIIPTAHKVEYINALIRVGFDTVETGSIVSPRHVPQMADSLEVLDRLDLSSNRSRLMMLVVNGKGGDIAAERDEISLISYPYSFSPEFLRRNMNTSQEDAFRTVEYLLNLCDRKGKSLVTYISMAFGSPYSEPWSLEILIEAVDKLQKAGCRTIALSNVSIPIGAERTSDAFHMLTQDFHCVEFGLHLHATSETWKSPLQAAWDQGCRRYDSVVNGLGGCPMTGGPLLGNLDTANLLDFCRTNETDPGINAEALRKATALASKYLHAME